MTILYVIIAIIVAVLILAAFVPKRMTITTSETINHPADQTWDYVRDFTHQTQYSVRVMADPNAIMTYSGTQWQVGAVQTRDSQIKNVGKGTQEITKIDGMMYEAQLRFERPMKATNYARTTIQDWWDGTCTVINEFWWDSPRPINLMSLAFKGKLTADMQQNLTNLKAVLEQ